MKLPRVSGFEAMKAFGRLGYRVIRQRGSHVIMHKDGCPLLVIPNHRELKKGTLKELIDDSGLTIERFSELLR